MAGRPPSGKMAVSKALAIIFAREGESACVEAVEKELKRMIGWSPARRTLYLYACKWNSGQFIEQRGNKPTKKKRLIAAKMKVGQFRTTLVE